MEFPRHVHQPDGRYVVVTNESDYDQLKAFGWTDQPDGHVERPVEVLLFQALAADVKKARKSKD